MGRTSIEWLNRPGYVARSWSPTTGCEAVSTGCAHCWARTIAGRFWEKQYRPVLNDGSGHAIDTISTSHHEDYLANGLARPRRFSDVQCHEDRLLEPLSWRKPSMVAVSLMGDLFHERISDDFLDRVFAVMALCPQHTFCLLTKRPERMRRYLTTTECVHPGAERRNDIASAGWTAFSDLDRADEDFLIQPDRWPLPNIWLGVSVENQETADARIPILLQTPAAVRFVSAEPLLSYVDLRHALHLTWTYSAGRSDHIPPPRINGGWWSDLGTMPHDSPKINWLIVGGESGRKARPMHPDWVRSLRDQCQVANVPFFYKQGPDEHGKLVSLPMLDGRQHQEWPKR